MTTMVEIPTDLEIEFTSGVWTNVDTYVIPGSVSWKRGVDAARKPATSTLSFVLDNADEMWTPGNTASTYFNKLKRGIGVRFSSIYSAVTRYHFRGIVTDIRPLFPDSGNVAGKFVEIDCEGISSLLAAYEHYGMALHAAVDVDDALTAIMVAVGSTLYSFEDSALTIPFVYPRGDALSDLVAVAQSEGGGLLWEDGQGRVRFKAIASMTGGHGAPAHTWGSTISPEGDIKPDWRGDSQFARQEVSLSVLKPSVEDVVLYRHPFGAHSIPEKIRYGKSRRIVGTFDEMPYSVVTTFSQAVASFFPIPSGPGGQAESLGQSMDATTTTLVTSSQLYDPNWLKPEDEVRVEQEVMRVVAILSHPPYAQRVTVERGYRGTAAVPHAQAAGAPPITIYWRQSVKTLTALIVGGLHVGLFNNVSNSATTFNTNDDGQIVFEVVAGTFIQVDSEIVRVNSVLSGPPRLTVTRGTYGTLAVSHLAGAKLYRTAFTVVQDVFGTSYIKSSTQAGGVPVDASAIIGASNYSGGVSIAHQGNKFTAGIYNSGGPTASDLYIADLVIGGKALRLNDAPVTVGFEKAIPYVIGIPQAPGLALPFGATNLNLAKGIAVGALRAARIPSPWLTLRFHANVSDNTVSMLTADMGDLVRYTGTGTNREKIDEFYRIQSIECEQDSLDQLHFTVALAPAHLWRNAAACFMSEFGHEASIVAGSGGALDVAGSGHSGLWSSDSQWACADVFDLSSSPNRLRAPGVAAPSSPIVDIGSASMVVEARMVDTPAGDNSYPANTGGIGVVFRSNSAGTNRWHVAFNRTSSLVILYNTTDTVVASAAWTPVTGAELSVRAEGDRIRVFVECQAEPLIDVTSTRFNTNTYAGLYLNRTILAGGGVNPYFTDWYGQAL